MNLRISFGLSAAAFAVCAVLHLLIASATGRGWPLIRRSCSPWPRF